ADRARADEQIAARNERALFLAEAGVGLEIVHDAGLDEPDTGGELHGRLRDVRADARDRIRGAAVPCDPLARLFDARLPIGAGLALEELRQLAEREPVLHERRADAVRAPQIEHPDRAARAEL